MVKPDPRCRTRAGQVLTISLVPFEKAVDRRQRLAVRLVEQAEQVIVDLRPAGDLLAEAQHVIV